MKCPKCSYLGFETGDRCKNCGYDFSLIELSPPEDLEIDLTLELADTHMSGPSDWAEQVDRALGDTTSTPEPMFETPATRTPSPEPLTAEPLTIAPVTPEPTTREPLTLASARSRTPHPPLPLFTPADAPDDEPLIKLPAAPRAPLAVRKTPEIPRLRAVPKPAARLAPEPVLEFADPPLDEEGTTPVSVTPTPDDDTFRPVRTRVSEVVAIAPGGAGARLAAAAVDHVILATIDVAVVYLTLRMAGLMMADWPLLPLAPLAVFLLLLKVSYFCAFTAIGGQTIGKMAMGIRVVTDEGAAVDGACAIRRTLAGIVSAIVLGLGFVPALFGSERRTLHDRLTHTRVVDLRSA